MKTLVLQPTEINIMRCAAALKAGRLVAFPTETVYALGASATDAKAVEKVFKVKNRPLDRPLIVAVADKSRITDVAKNIPEKAQKLIDAFMPGALTLVLDRAECIPNIVTAGSDSVAVRIPDNKIARKLIMLSGGAVVVPSANTSDKPSTTLASHVLDDLDGKIEYILDGGASEIGIESTVIDTRCEPPVILREGGVAAELIESVIGSVVYKRDTPRDGCGYVPKAELLFSAFYDGMTDNIISRYDSLAARENNVVILCLDGNADCYGERRMIKLGADYTAYAHNLFAALRSADAMNADCVIAEGVNPEGIGASLIAKLIKLSGGLII